MPPSDAELGRVTRFADARTQLRQHCQPHGRVTSVAVGRARGRTAAETVHAPRPVPHYERAAVDGFAVRAEDTVGASGRSPVRLDETTGTVQEGTAVRVHTGSARPEGADAVVMVEHVDRRMEGLAVYDAVAPGENVAPVGEDIEEGAQLLAAGDHIAPADQALVRAVGLDELTVRERPRVSVVPTGEELVEADPEVGEVVETNGPMLSSLVDRWGGGVTPRDPVADDEAALREAIERDCDHDVVVTSGGTAAGERDHVADAIDALGELVVHGVSLQPGTPVGVGVVAETPVLALPGYPVSCLVTAVQFLRPALAWVDGHEPQPYPTVPAQLDGKLRSEPGTRTFARVTLEQRPDNGPTWQATPLRVAGAGALSSVAFADGWVEIPEEREGIPAGETVPVQRWDWEWQP